VPYTLCKHTHTHIFRYVYGKKPTPNTKDFFSKFFKCKGQIPRQLEAFPNYVLFRVKGLGYEPS
jgi:hypothetical protein